MFEFDTSHLPTAIDITLYKYNYIDNKIWAQLNNQVDFIQVSDDSIIVSKDQLVAFLEANYLSDLNKFKSVGTEMFHKEINSTYFLNQMCIEMDNVKYFKITLNSKKDYSRLVDIEGMKILQFSFKILTATLRLSHIYNNTELAKANEFLEKIGLLRPGSPFVRINAKDLASIIDANVDDEVEEHGILLDIIDILEHRLEKDNSLILLITDY